MILSCEGLVEEGRLSPTKQTRQLFLLPGGLFRLQSQEFFFLKKKILVLRAEVRAEGRVWGVLDFGETNHKCTDGAAWVISG